MADFRYERIEPLRLRSSEIQHRYAAAGASSRKRFSTPESARTPRWLTADKNLFALADLSGRPMVQPCSWPASAKGAVLDIDSSVRQTHGEQGNSVWNAHRLRRLSVRACQGPKQWQVGLGLAPHLENVGSPHTSSFNSHMPS
jgi:hypothetical protein